MHKIEQLLRKDFERLWTHPACSRDCGFTPGGSRDCGFIQVVPETGFTQVVPETVDSPSGSRDCGFTQVVPETVDSSRWFQRLWIHPGGSRDCGFIQVVPETVDSSSLFQRLSIHPGCPQKLWIHPARSSLSAQSLPSRSKYMKTSQLVIRTKEKADRF